MYVPRFFEETRPEWLFRLMREYEFATLLSCTGSKPTVSHLPFELETTADGKATLLAHMARANPHWRELGEVEEALVIFQGPHAYISPAWYPPHPDNVPTWNYAVVHAYGRPRLVEAPDAVDALMQRMVSRQEAAHRTGWRLDPAALARKRAAIVAFAIEVTRLEGKFKLSQQQNPQIRKQVARGLGQSSDPVVRQTGEWMLEVVIPTGG